jgi:hypothetical protein
MPKSKRSNKALSKYSKTPVLIDDNMPDLANDPVFMAKHEKAEKLIAEFGLPKSIKLKTKSKAKNQKKV